jgi:hypothetical protein
MSETLKQWWDTGTQWLDNALGNIIPDVIEKPLRSFDYYAVRPVVRSTLAASQDAGTLLTWIGSENWKSLTGQQKEMGLGESWDKWRRQFIYGSGTSDMGTGYRPGGQAFQSSLAGIQDERARVGSHAFTFGRAAAYPLVKIGVINEDDFTHKIISGTIDAAVVIKNPVDPFNRIPGFRPGTTAATSRAGVGGVRITNLEDFTRVFDDLQTRVEIAKQSGSPLTAAQKADLDQLQSLTQNLTATATKNVNLPNGTVRPVAAFDAAEVWGKWKPLLDEAMDDAYNKIGLVQDVLPTFIKDNFTAWKTSAAGTQWATDLLQKVRSGQLNAGELWRTVLNQEGILSAKILVDRLKNPQTDITDVFNILDEARASFNSGYNLRRIGQKAFDTLRMGQANILKTASQKRGYQVLEVLPESTKIGFTDVEQSARNLDNIMGAFGFEYAERNMWLDRYAQAMVGGTKDDFFAFMRDFEKNAIRAQLGKYTKVGSQDPLLTETQIEAFSSWSQKLRDEVMGFVYDDISTDVPLPYIESGSQGPLRTSQLMADDYYVIPPQIIDQVLRLQTGMGKLVETIKQTDAALVAQTYDGARNLISGYMTNYWKPSAVIKFGHTLRVGTEEVFRVNLSGIMEHPMEWFFSVIGQRLRTDAAGNRIPLRIANVQKFWKQYAKVEDELLQALDLQQKAANGATLTPAQTKLVGRVQELTDQLDDLDARVPNETYEIYNSLIGPRSRGAWLSATNEYAPAMINMRRRGAVQFPERVNAAGQPANATARRAWVNGLTHELSDMHSMPDYQRIAQQALESSDKLTINGQTLTIAQHIKNGAVHPFTGQPLANNIDAVKLWLYSGEGRQYFTGYFDNTANLKPQYKNGGYDNYSVASERADLIFEKDIMHHTGGDPKLLEVIATGLFGGQRAVFKLATGRGTASPNLLAYLSDDFINAPYAPRRVRNFPTNELQVEGPQSTLQKLNNGLNYLYRAYFEGVYGSVSDATARGPAWRANYWNRMEELVRFMSPDEAQKVLQSAEKAKLGRARIDRISVQVALAKGEGTLEAADKLAGAFATKATNDLLYKGNRSSIAQQHKVFFPFLSSFVEVFSTWAKLASQSPRIIRNTAQFLESAEDEGYIYRNQYGEKVLEVPMTGRLAQLFLGRDTSPIGNFTINLKALNVIGQMRPGVGPVVQYFVDKITPQRENYDWIREWMSPFGTPKLGEGGLVQPFIPRSVNDFLSTFGTDEAKFGDAVKLFFGDPKQKEYYEKGVVRMHQYLVNNYVDKYLGKDGLEQSYEDAEEAMLKLQRYRAAMAALGPAAPITNWVAKTKYGNTDLGVLLSDLSKKEQAAIENGQPIYTAFNQWLDQWGELVWVYSGRITKATVGGLQATREWQKWAGDNKELLDKYGSVAGYFGPQSGEFDIDVYRQQYDNDRREVNNLEEATKQSHQRMGDFVYYRFLESVPVDQRTSSIFRAQRDELVNTLQQDLALWERPSERVVTSNQRTRDQLSDLRAISQDPQYQGNELVRAVKEYFDIRDQSLDNFLAANPKVTVESWVRDSKASLPIRQHLEQNVAPYLVSKYPQFLQLWDRVLSAEFAAVTE